MARYSSHLPTPTSLRGFAWTTSWGPSYGPTVRTSTPLCCTATSSRFHRLKRVELGHGSRASAALRGPLESAVGTRALLLDHRCEWRPATEPAGTSGGPSAPRSTLASSTKRLSPPLAAPLALHERRALWPPDGCSATCTPAQKPPIAGTSQGVSEGTRTPDRLDHKRAVRALTSAENRISKPNLCSQRDRCVHEKTAISARLGSSSGCCPFHIHEPEAAVPPKRDPGSNTWLICG
jgi:hypothetical protein